MVRTPESGASLLEAALLLALIYQVALLSVLLYQQELGDLACRNAGELNVLLGPTEGARVYHYEAGECAEVQTGFF